MISIIYSSCIVGIVWNICNIYNVQCMVPNIQFVCFQFRSFNYSNPIGTINKLSVSNHTGTVSACFWPFDCYMPYSFPTALTLSLSLNTSHLTFKYSNLCQCFLLCFVCLKQMFEGVFDYLKGNHCIQCHVLFIQMAIRRVGGPMHFAPLYLRFEGVLQLKIMAKH